MSYSLAFVESALREWRKLATPIREQFKHKLAERLGQPRVPSAKLHGMADCYKIKLHSAGYRLVHEVDDKTIVVIVIAVGRCDKGAVHRKTTQRKWAGRARIASGIRRAKRRPGEAGRRA